MKRSWTLAALRTSQVLVIFVAVLSYSVSEPAGTGVLGTRRALETAVANCSLILKNCCSQMLNLILAMLQKAPGS